MPASRDPGELETAAYYFLALRHELEDASGRAQELASDAQAYGNAAQRLPTVRVGRDRRSGSFSGSSSPK